MREDSAIDVLVRFGRMVSDVVAPEDILPLLVDAVIDHVGASGAVALRLGEDGTLRVAAARAVPGAVPGRVLNADALGPELIHEVLELTDTEDHRVIDLPLVSSGGLFGVVVMLGPHDFQPPVELARGLADLAAVSLDRTAQFADLARSHAELKASREALARGEKLGALGKMAAGISHDIKNILNPLGLHLELLRRRITKDPAAALESVAAMQEVIRHGLDVVERLRAFSRQEPEGAEPVDLDETCSTAVELVRARLAPEQALSLETHRPPPVTARASELVTAIVNLVLNAVEAADSRTLRIVVRTGQTAARGWVEVEDDGPGMPPDVQGRVFEPFFTTKATGTGLGLAMVYAFVQRHGGAVDLDSSPGRGTRIRLSFPLAEPSSTFSQA